VRDEMFDPMRCFVRNGIHGARLGARRATGCLARNGMLGVWQGDGMTGTRRDVRRTMECSVRGGMFAVRWNVRCATRCSPRDGMLGARRDVRPDASLVTLGGSFEVCSYIFDGPLALFVRMKLATYYRGREG
jgi:hypothetical protein